MTRPAPWATAVPSPARIDWRTEREAVDLAAVATALLGPPPGRRGERGRRMWWHCPFHQDRNPSFAVDPGKGRWRCFGCGQHGDAADLVMRVQGVTFPEAVSHLTGGPTPTRPAKAPRRPVATPRAEPPPEPSGLPEADALTLVEAAAAELWSPEGAEALAYLAGPRCLSLETIKAARLGWTPGASVPTRDGGRTFRAVGVVIPWFDPSGRPALVKVRQPDGRRPKYAEAFRDPARLVCYPSPAAIRPGRPVIVTEGEMDALCLGEALGGLATVVTLGSASERPGPGVLDRMLSAPRWFVATDADDAGDRAAAAWPARGRRVRPPVVKDWTDTREHGVDLRRWWSDVLAGVDRPALFSWPELAGWRWGGATEADAGIDNPGRRPNPETLAAALRQGAAG